jgi:hypothetical protein
MTITAADILEVVTNITNKYRWTGTDGQMPGGTPYQMVGGVTILHM